MTIGPVDIWDYVCPNCWHRVHAIPVPNRVVCADCGNQMVAMTKPQETKA